MSLILINILDPRQHAKYSGELSNASIQVLVSSHFKMRTVRQRYEVICPRITEGSRLCSGTDSTVMVPDNYAIILFINCILIGWKTSSVA